MTEDKAKQILDKIIEQIFGYANPLSLQDFKRKYAFDLRLPIQVNDAETGEPTWTQSVNPTKFMTLDNTFSRVDSWEQPKQELKNIQDVLKAWEKINYVTTERQIDSLNILESDNVNQSENVYHSMDVHNSKNVIFSDGAIGCEFVAAIQRSNTTNYSARVEDSTNCSNSFSVSWSGKIVNSMFIHDSFDMYECLFCSHMRSKKFCIANMQFEEAEYFKLKEEIVKWVLSSE